MNSSGEILWTYILREDDEDIWMSTDMISCSDGGLLVSGCPGQQLLGGFVFKLSPDGRLEWMTHPEEITGFVSAPVTVTETGISSRAGISWIDDSFWLFSAVESHVLYGERLYPQSGARNEISVQLP